MSKGKQIAGFLLSIITGDYFIFRNNFKICYPEPEQEFPSSISAWAKCKRIAIKYGWAFK